MLLPKMTLLSRYSSSESHSQWSSVQGKHSQGMQFVDSSLFD